MSGYPQTLKYFMWEWQVHFRISCQVSAESVFNNLDKDLSPNVFFIGFRNSEKKDGEMVCLEPEDLPFTPKELLGFLNLADEMYEKDPENQMLYSGEGIQEEMNRRKMNVTYGIALEDILNKSPNNVGNIHFVSSWVLIDGYYVFIILALNKIVYENHLNLSFKDSEDRMKKYFSLLEAAKDSFLQERVRNLYYPNPGYNTSIDSREGEEMLREAAKKFTYTIAWVGKNGEGIHLLYSCCEKISVSKYEGANTNGHLIVARQHHPQIEMTLEIEKPFRIDDIRKTRKMLELSNEEIGVVTNSGEILGLGKIKKDYDAVTESIFKIKFNGSHCWEVFHNSKSLFQMRYGLPQFSGEVINKEKFVADAKRIFQEITDSQIINLFELAIAVTSQERGAILVIVGDAAEEARRLNKQCINIRPLKLDKALLLNLTSIDGAVIIDLNGMAYAKAVVLDGVVGITGDSARGSRYNSALTYQEFRGHQKPTLIVVVSEDGMVDIIPSLKPQIKHSEIMQVIAVLEELNTPEKFKSSSFYDAMGWLQNRQFYLTETECEKINDLKNSLQQLDQTSRLRTVWRTFEDLIPDPEMNERYYIRET